MVLFLLLSSPREAGDAVAPPSIPSRRAHTSGPAKGNAPFISHQFVQEVTFSLGLSDNALGDQSKNGTWIEPYAWQPRAFVIHNLLSDEECDHLIEAGKDGLKRSTVVKGYSNGEKEENIYKGRSSDGAWVDRYLDTVVGEIEERVAILSAVPAPHGEAIQILRYQLDQRYSPHEDTFKREHLSAKGGMQRIATVLMYLSDVESGGETNFPQGKVANSYLQDHGSFSTKKNEECGGWLAAGVTPKKGDALLFWSMDPQFVYRDHLSLHEGCPVTAGTKWSATIWMHQQAFQPDIFAVDFALAASKCGDNNKNCRSWARAGECSNSQRYMKQHCRLSCGLCGDRRSRFLGMGRKASK